MFYDILQKMHCSNIPRIGIFIPAALSLSVLLGQLPNLESLTSLPFCQMMSSGDCGRQADEN